MVLAALMPGPILWLLYNLITDQWPNLQLGLAGQSTIIATIVASFAVTMLGFLAAIVTILFSVSGSRAFRRYKQKNYLNNFFISYYVTLISLLVTAAWSLLALSSLISAWGVKVLLALFANNLVQLAMVITPIFNLVRISHEEPHNTTTKKTDAPTNLLTPINPDEQH